MNAMAKHDEGRTEVVLSNGANQREYSRTVRLPQKVVVSVGDTNEQEVMTTKNPNSLTKSGVTTGE